MNEKSYIICMTELSDKEKEAIESLRRCYNSEIEEYNAIQGYKYLARRGVPITLRLTPRGFDKLFIEEKGG